MDTLLSCCLHDPARESLIYIPRFTHRLSLTKAWGIRSGQRLMDIGCGQGESVLVLAMLVGPLGHVTGVDDAPPDYGTPFAVRESHEYIVESALGPRISFHHGDAASFLQSPDAPPSTVFDAAVLCHSLWYFPSHDSVFSLFHTLAEAQIPIVHIGEYSTQASHASQRPHVLAAQVLVLLDSCKEDRGPTLDPLAPNVRAAMDQASILEAAKEAGFRVQRQGAITPEEDMLEGHFEARYIKGDAFRKHVKGKNLPAEREREILDLAEQVKEQVDELERGGVSHVRAMDSWWATLELDALN